MENRRSFLLFVLAVAFFGILLRFAIDESGKPSFPHKVQEKAMIKIPVNYEIQFGSIYTGDQTPMVYHGIDSVAVNKDFGIGYGGLPITGFAPTHSQLSLNLGGERATLYIACGTPIPPDPSWKPDGLLTIDGVQNRVPMKVEVFREENNVLVKASPADLKD